MVTALCWTWRRKMDFEFSLLSFSQYWNSRFDLHRLFHTVAYSGWSSSRPPQKNCCCWPIFVKQSLPSGSGVFLRRLLWCRFESKSQKHSYDLDLHGSAELFVVMKLFAFLGLLVVLSQVTFATEDGARLLVRKRVLNQEVVLERETFVQIDIFNVGPG